MDHWFMDALPAVFQIKKHAPWRRYCKPNPQLDPIGVCEVYYWIDHNSILRCFSPLEVFNLGIQKIPHDDMPWASNCTTANWTWGLVWRAEGEILIRTIEICFLTNIRWAGTHIFMGRCYHFTMDTAMIWAHHPPQRWAAPLRGVHVMGCRNSRISR